MRYAALNPGGLTRLVDTGAVEMRGLLSPAECNALRAPDGVKWHEEEATDPTRSWSHSDECRFGPHARELSPALQRFLICFRGLVQVNAQRANIPELAAWGRAPYGSHRAVSLVGLQRVVYGAKWHTTPANHEIGWHTDNTFHLAKKEKGQVPLRALGMMVAINLSEYGGTYELAPADADENDRTQLMDPITNIKQGDAVGFCTARTADGQLWPGSFPKHRLITDSLPSDVDPATLSRDSLVVFFRYVEDPTLRDLGPRGVLQIAREKATHYLSAA